jgi:uncharacterized protein
MDKKIEVRTLPIELRTEDDSQKIVGYAAVYDQLSEDLGGFKEKIRKGAFANSIKKDDIKLLFNHDPNYVLGRNKNGTLKLEEDEHGLKIEATPPETSFAKDLMSLMERGDVDQMSFGFIVNEDEWDTADRENPIRTLLDVELFDTSVVVYPAYKQTSVNVRTTEDVYKEYKDKINQQSQEARKLDEIEARTQERKAKLRKVKTEIYKRGVKL